MCSKVVVFVNFKIRNQMKNIFILLLCIIVTQQTNAQIRCNSSGITTNPDAPSKDICNTQLNTFD
jgi:hypothetical protein